MREAQPIVDEVRAARELIAKQGDNDLARIAEAVRARERHSGRSFVRLPPRTPANVRHPR